MGSVTRGLYSSSPVFSSKSQYFPDPGWPGFAVRASGQVANAGTKPGRGDGHADAAGEGAAPAGNSERVIACLGG
jgi:hypothetical protein